MTRAEVRNRFKGLDLIDRVPEEQWTEVCNTVQEAVIKTIPKKEKCTQAPLSMGILTQEYQRGCHAFLQGIFPTQDLNRGLWHCRLYQVSYEGSPQNKMPIYKYWPNIGFIIYISA